MPLDSGNADKVEPKLEGTAHMGTWKVSDNGNLDVAINHIRRPTGGNSYCTHSFVRCIDNRPMPTSVGILLDPDCKRRPKTTDRGSAIKKVAKISFFFFSSSVNGPRPDF
ncbi:hypothetical protein LB504_000700 [Fusarium proliferatum]|nr:hypothetical protein LB504_000700 [Fusarium proliferatum]